uniref:Mobile element protein n=1 Tax=Steinernema glaseri TaxID=37863 RepID=A0A1I8A2K7_9BILA
MNLVAFEIADLLERLFVLRSQLEAVGLHGAQGGRALGISVDRQPKELHCGATPPASSRHWPAGSCTRSAQYRSH